MENLQNLYETVSEQLGAMAQSDIAVGAPIAVGNVTLIPLCRVSVGFGAGGGTGEGNVNHRKQQCGRGTGGGTGGGGKVRPVAVIVFSEQGVEVLQVGDSCSRLEKFLEKIPELVSHFKCNKSAKEDCGCGGC
jgi:uncharacterized spore protein YtfJ